MVFESPNSNPNTKKSSFRFLPGCKLLIPFGTSFEKEQCSPSNHIEWRISLKVGVYPRWNLSFDITDMYSGYDNMVNFPTDRFKFFFPLAYFLPEQLAKALV